MSDRDNHGMNCAHRSDSDEQAKLLKFLGGCYRTTRAHVWTESPGVEVQTYPDEQVPHSLRLVIRDVHAKADLASVRIEAFRLDLLCGPIVRLMLQHQIDTAAAAVKEASK